MNLKTFDNTERVFSKLNFRDKKMLISYSDNPNKANVAKHLKVIGKHLNL